MAALPLWKKPGTSYWSLLSEGLEETNAGNEKDGDDAAPEAEHHSLLSLFSALHALKLPTQDLAFGSIPLYLRYCNLKIDLV